MMQIMRNGRMSTIWKTKSIFPFFDLVVWSTVGVYDIPEVWIRDMDLGRVDADYWALGKSVEGTKWLQVSVPYFLCHSWTLNVN